MDFVKQLGWKLLRLLLWILVLLDIAGLFLAFYLEGTEMSTKLGFAAGLIVLICLLGWVSAHVGKGPSIPVEEMTGPEFETYCGELLLKEGFSQISMTPATGDFGADLIARDKKGLVWVFQCKRYAGKVGNSAVQEVVAAMAHYQADRAGVMTNSVLTEKARQLALENDVLFYENIR